MQDMQAGGGRTQLTPIVIILTIILQAYTKSSDAEAIEALTMYRRWQLVVDCLDCEQAPFSQTTLVRFRQAATQTTRGITECTN